MASTSSSSSMALVLREEALPCVRRSALCVLAPLLEAGASSTWLPACACRAPGPKACQERGCLSSSKSGFDSVDRCDVCETEAVMLSALPLSDGELILMSSLSASSSTSESSGADEVMTDGVCPRGRCQIGQYSSVETLTNKHSRLSIDSYFCRWWSTPETW